MSYKNSFCWVLRGEREGAEWVVREGVGGQGGEMNQALYAHMNNKRKRKKKFRFQVFLISQEIR
jgi:hypothetical protein